MLVKRTEDVESSNDPNESSDVDRDSGSGIPTHHEAKEMLSPEEFKSYIETWRNHKAYRRARYAAKKARKRGREPTPEVIREIELNKSRAAAHEKLEKLVERRLVQAGKARPKTLALIGRRVAREKERKTAKILENKALKDRIDAKQASEQDIRAWGILKAQRSAKVEKVREWRAKKRMQDIESPESGLDKNREEAKTEASNAQHEAGQTTWQDRKDQKKPEPKDGTKVETERRKSGRPRKTDTQDPKISRELELDRKRKWAKADYEAKRIKTEALRARIEDPKAKVTPQDREAWNKLEAERLTKNERTRLWRVRERVRKLKAASEANSNSSKNKTSNEIPSKGVDHFESVSLQSFGNPLVHGAHRLIENLRDKWEAIPWSSYWPRSKSDKPSGGWSTNQPIYSPPVLRRIPLNVFP